MIKAFSVVDIGKKRKMNQDCAFTSDLFVGKLPNLFMVADGMGGHKAGDYASRCAIDTIVDYATNCEEESTIGILEKAIHKANGVIRERSAEDESLNGMGTTLVAAVVDKDILWVANVGDSRLYIFNNREIRQITKDHSLVEEMVRMGGLKREMARNHPDKNIITRALGATDRVDVDFFRVTLSEGDIVLLCSDGLTNMLEDEEIRMILQGKRDIVEKAESLVAAANNNGGKDNIAVVLVEPFASID